MVFFLAGGLQRVFSAMVGEKTFLFFASLCGSGLIAYGLVVECFQQAKAFPSWLRPQKRKIFRFACVFSVAVGWAVSTLLGSPEFGWCGLVFIPWFIRPAEKILRFDTTRRLEESSLPFFHALLGFSRAGLAIPNALLLAIQAAPGPFSFWLEDRLACRQKGEGVSEALSRMDRALPQGGASATLKILTRLHAEGLAVLSLLENQIAWMARDQARHRRLFSLQSSLLLQGAVCTSLPWLVLWFSGFGDGTFSQGDLWKSPVWLSGLFLTTLWQGVGIFYLLRLGRFF